MAFSVAQPTTPQPTDASEDINTAGWGTFLWIAVVAVVFFVLLTAAVLGLIGGRSRTRE